MDKLYKAHFLSQLKARMPLERPEFAPRKLPTDATLRRRFAGSLLYLQALASGRCVWLEWFPGDGVERVFHACLGWSLHPEALPVNTPGDTRIHFLREPGAGLACGTLDVQAVEGRQVVCGFTIATPWDPLYALSPRTPEHEQKRVRDKAHADYLAVTEAERIEAVRHAMNEAFASIASVLPRFTSSLEALVVDSP
jgi:hypothetical protein